MNNNNTQLSAKNLFATESVKAKFQELLGNRAPAFITSVLQIVSSNNLLANADPNSVYHSAAVAATLDLPLNNNLGFAYIVPYNAKQQDGSYKQVAQFQMGYKGFIQLAQRSGQVRKIYAAEIYEGQLLSSNPLEGYVFDFSKKESDKVVGYAARIELLNGFESVLYMTVEELKNHGVKYSQTFKKGYGLWKDDFDAMAKKTVTKLLISKYAPLSVEMQKAVVVDQAIINDVDAKDVTYVDHTEVIVSPELVAETSERERIIKHISNSVSIGQLREVSTEIDPSEDKELSDIFDAKLNELSQAK